MKCIRSSRPAPKHRTQSCEPGFGPVLSFRTLASVFTLSRSGSLRCMKEYLAIHSGGYVCTNGFRVLLATLLHASGINQNVVRLNSSAKE